MFGLFKKKQVESPILSVFHDDNLVCEIRKSELPCEKTPVIFASNKGSSLRFIDNCGVEHQHKLSYESGYFHLSVRVHENLGCQADCLVSANMKIVPDAFQKLEVNGIRFQPFFLSGGEITIEKDKGSALENGILKI